MPYTLVVIIMLIMVRSLINRANYGICVLALIARQTHTRDSGEEDLWASRRHP